MKIYEVQAPDGSILKIEGPENATDAQLIQAAQAAYRPQTPVAEPKPEPQQDQVGVMQTLGNIGAGALRGAGSIGATLLSPIDAAARAMGIENSVIGRRDRREAMTEGLRSMGAEPESLAFQAGKIGGEIAGTAAVPGMLAKGAQALKVAPSLVNALRTSGAAKDAGLLTRVAGGAASGAATAGAINPEEIATGAAFGGALPIAGALARAGATGIKQALGATTGAGEKALSAAYEAGKQGGKTAQAFRENLRGKANMMDVLDDAKANLEAIRQARSAAYRQNMAAVKGAPEVIDMAPIEKSVQSAIDSFTFRGQAKNPQVARALQEVAGDVSSWRQLYPADFHTAEGLDALKQRIGAIRESLPMEARSARAAVDGVYNSVKREIEAKAPEYANAMRDYSQASELIDEITRALSLNERATADTAMRKLQSIMRNNVNTNYGARSAAMQALEEQGGRELVPALAGQALNDWMPRGIQRATGAIGTLGAGSLAGLPGAAGMAAASSPRLVGEALYGAGRVAGASDPIVRALRSGAYRAAPVIGAQ